MTREGWLMIIPVCSLCLFLHHFVPHCTSSQRAHTLTHSHRLPPINSIQRHFIGMRYTFRGDCAHRRWDEVQCSKRASFHQGRKASSGSQNDKAESRRELSRMIWYRFVSHDCQIGTFIQLIWIFFAPHYKDQRVSLVWDRTPVNSVPAKIQQETLIDENKMGWVRP